MKDRWILHLGIIAVLIGCIQAGPFYECRPGSEQRYQVNLCVDRCPEVGSQRGCTGNRTCCLVGCARICFHERRTTPSSQLENLQEITTSASMLASSYARQVNNEIQNGDQVLNETVNVTASTSASKVGNETTVGEQLLSSAASDQPLSFNEGSGMTAEPTTWSSSVGVSITDDMATESARVLGKLRFSTSLDKGPSKTDEKLLMQAVAAVKAPQQWNGVTDNVVSSLDDAQHAVTSAKGSESALMWQIFEFLRIIQSKLDVMSSSNVNAGNAAVVEAGASAIRSKPPISPNDPNILIRKSLSEFSKTLNKVQGELASLSAGQQQVVRILERVFVNQLRLANGAAAFVAATANSINNSRRQQRWQQEQPQKLPPPTINPLSQLMPLAEAILLDNAALLGNDFSSSCYRLNGCSFDACRVTRCDKYPQATCRVNSCRNCLADFFVGNSLVQCK